jgi:phosphopantothenoylcysteine decarboxylase/phosphopantothenate--cysteine ligase
VNWLVTAGPTREPIDPVRFVSNRSSGKMGFAVAQAAAARGHSVTLVSGPVTLATPPGGIRRIDVVTADDMLAAVTQCLPAADVFVMAAAVADWRPASVSPLKLKKRDGPPSFSWVPTPDILRSVARLKRPGQLFCGFAAETNDVRANARAKLRAKSLDAIAANDVSLSDRGFASDSNAISLFLSDGTVFECPLSSKLDCAAFLVDRLETFSRFLQN